MTATSIAVHHDHVLRGAVASIRPSDTGLVVLGSVLGARLAHLGTTPLVLIALVVVANGLLSAGSMAFNDWHDVREDAINKPRRPIVSGLIAREQVLGLAIALLGAGIVAAWLAGIVFGLAAMVIVGASVIYTTRLKTVPLLGNALMAAIMSYPLWCWVLVREPLAGKYVALCLAVIGYRFGAELVKTAEDRRGDRLSGLRTVATLWGARPALLLGCASLAIATAIAWWPAAAGIAGAPYAVWLLPVTVLTVLACAESGREKVPPEVAARRVNRLERISLLLAAVALGVGLD